MMDVYREKNVADPLIMLALLDSVDRDGDQSQRRLAAELGVALGLVNAYLKRCIKKGLVKVAKAPRRRFAYYLTSQGFAEKSRLAADYLSRSFEFFREAKSDCHAVFGRAAEAGLCRLVLAGKSDLAEIFAICASQSDAAIVAVLDPGATESQFLGIPLVRSVDALPADVDGIVITDLVTPRQTCLPLIEMFGPARVLVPELLRLRINPNPEPER